MSSMLECPLDLLYGVTLPNRLVKIAISKGLANADNRASTHTTGTGRRRKPARCSPAISMSSIRYAMSRRRSLERFLDDGRIEIDSNVVERAIRPQTTARKNSLFAGSDGGGRTWATIASLLQTARMNGVDPFAWLKLSLERLA